MSLYDVQRVAATGELIDVRAVIGEGEAEQVVAFLPHYQRAREVPMSWGDGDKAAPLQITRETLADEDALNLWLRSGAHVHETDGLSDTERAIKGAINGK